MANNDRLLVQILLLVLLGASLWVFNAPNRSAAEFRGVAQFLNFLRFIWLC